MSMKVSVRIDDVNPLIQYAGSWRAGTQASDSFFNRYSDGGTFTLTQSNEASATIHFNGTGVQVFGAKRGNHNLYTTELDGDIRTGNGQNTQAETFNQSLYASPVLSNADHTLVIRDASTNSDPNQSYFDIDYVIIDTEVQGTKSLQLDDSDPAFSYGPDSSAWNTAPVSVTAFLQGTGHSTSSAQASVTLSFTGSAVDVFGLVCASCGEYWVSVDNAEPSTFSAFNTAWTKPQTLLYMARNLNDGPHTIKLTNLAAQNGNTLNIDYANVYGNSPSGGIANTSSSGGGNGSGSGAGTSENQNGGTSTSSNGPPVGAIVGGVLGGLLILVVGLALILFFLRRKRKQEAQEQAFHPQPAMMGYAPSVAGGSMAGSSYNPYNVQQPFHVPPTGSNGGYGGAGGYPQGAYGGPGMAGAAGMGYYNPSQPNVAMPVGPPSHSGSASLPYMQSDVSGPSAAMDRRLSSIGSASGDTPPDYHAATFNGPPVPPMPIRRKN